MSPQLAIVLATALALSACTGTGSGGQTAASDTDSKTAHRIAVHQQQRAIQEDCRARRRAAIQNGATADQVSELNRACIGQVDALSAQLARDELSQDQSIYGDTTRLMVAGRDLEKSGDEQGAFRTYQTVEANAAAIEAEVSRANASNAPLPAQSQQDRMRRMDADALLSQLGIAETKIGVYYERRGDYTQAAAYYRKAIATRSLGSLMATKRLAFLYAYGRGVPRDRDMTRRLFIAFGGENGFSYLLDHDRLPDRIEDVTQNYVEKVKDEEARKSLFAFLILMAAFSAGGGGGQQHATPHQTNCAAVNYFYSPGFAGMQGCWPY
jgi:tetratricopeptide (TPR) repeat protein